MFSIAIFEADYSGHHETYIIKILNELEKHNTKVLFITSEYYRDKFKNNFRNVQFLLFPKILIRLWKNKNLLIRQVSLFFTMIYTILILKKHKIDKIFFPYFDLFLVPVFFLSSLFGHICIIGTLHWYPKNNVKTKMLKSIIDRKNVKSIVVHEKSIFEKIVILSRKKICQKKINVINYPSFTMKNNFYEYIEIIKNKLEKKCDTIPKFLYFGGTRYDKGLDILLDSLRLVSTKIHLTIAGEEDYFKRDFIESKIYTLNKNNIEVSVILRYISEQEKEELFLQSDYVILPYRKVFFGQSGPLIEGISFGCIPIMPDLDVFKEFYDLYRIGILYRTESIESLAQAINTAANMNHYMNSLIDLKNFEIFYHDRNPDRFSENYLKILFSNEN